jgi:predicted RNase H-like HicB family nuclease
LVGVGVAGATIDEARQLLTEAIEMHLAGMREDGIAIPPPSTHVEEIAISA